MAQPFSEELKQQWKEDILKGKLSSIVLPYSTNVTTDSQI